MKKTIYNYNSKGEWHGYQEWYYTTGNIFTKFGDINTKYIISHHKVLTKGAKVRIMGEIKDHSEFRGVKSTLINIPPKFN